MEDTQELDVSEGELEALVLPSQTQEAKAWGRLASLDLHLYPDIVLEKSEETIGQQHCKNNPKVSREHARIVRSTEGALVEDWSSTVLQVNGTPVPKGSLVKLSEKDTITLGKAEAGCPHYLFLVADSKKRSREEASQSQSSLHPASPSRASSSVQTGQNGGQSSIGASPLKKMKGVIISDEEKFEKHSCGICHEIWHNCASTIPCLHNFCAACLSDWVKRANTCPKCRGNLTAVKKNCDLNALVEDLLKEHPEKRRDPAELAEEDKRNIFDKDPFPLPIGRRIEDVDSDENESDAQDSDEEQAGCPQCPPAQRGGYTCLPLQAHISCSACSQQMPDRGLPIQRCSWCRRIGCDLYFRSLPAPRNGLPTGCTAPEAARLKRLNERVWTDIPNASFRAFGPQPGLAMENQVEQQILRQYLTDHQKAIQDVVQEMLDKVQLGDWDFPQEHTHPMVAPGFPFPADLAPDCPLCGNCADGVIGGLLYKYREAIPKAELPAAFRNREDCHWGWQCRTQRHNIRHAQNYNHICPKTRHNEIKPAH